MIYFDKDNGLKTLVYFGIAVFCGVFTATLGAYFVVELFKLIK